MRNKIILLIVSLVPAICAADDFMALPGLWKTSYRTAQDVGLDVKAAEPQILWHCVTEDQDPWIAFAQWVETPEMSCTRPTQQRTSTTLKWKIDCQSQGAAKVSSEGNIVFDSSQHYTGSIRLSGMLLGFPLLSITQVEGKRYAACTSPQD